MKKLVSLLLLALLLTVFFGGCTSKTPDVVESEKNNVTLEDLDWAIPITIEATGESVTYTMAQAKAHELAKTYISAYQFTGDNGDGSPQVTTMILQGVRFSDVLADLGVTACSGITVIHNNIADPFEFDEKIVWSDDTLIGWIQNLNMVVEDSAPSYVAFGSKEAGVHDFCHSVKAITIHP